MTSWRAIYNKNTERRLSIFLTGQINLCLLLGWGKGEKDCILRMSAASEFYSPRETEGIEKYLPNWSEGRQMWLELHLLSRQQRS